MAQIEKLVLAPPDPAVSGGLRNEDWKQGQDIRLLFSNLKLVADKVNELIDTVNSFYTRTETDSLRLDG